MATALIPYIYLLEELLAISAYYLTSSLTVNLEFRIVYLILKYSHIFARIANFNLRRRKFYIFYIDRTMSMYR